MVRIILIVIIRKIRIISIYFLKFRIFTVISIHFVKFKIFTLISIPFINFRINTSISIHIARKLKILRVHILWLFCWLFAYNSLKLYNTRMHIGIQIYYRENKIYMSRYIKLNLDKTVKFIFWKRGFKGLFSAKHEVAICRIQPSY